MDTEQNQDFSEESSSGEEEEVETRMNPVVGLNTCLQRVTYGIPVEVEAFDKESNLIGSIPSEDIVTEDPVIIGLNPNMAFKSLNL